MTARSPVAGVLLALLLAACAGDRPGLAPPRGRPVSGSTWSSGDPPALVPLPDGRAVVLWFGALYPSAPDFIDRGQALWARILDARGRPEGAPRVIVSEPLWGLPWRRLSAIRVGEDLEAAWDLRSPDCLGDCTFLGIARQRLRLDLVAAGPLLRHPDPEGEPRPGGVSLIDLGPAGWGAAFHVRPGPAWRIVLERFAVDGTPTDRIVVAEEPGDTLTAVTFPVVVETRSGLTVLWSRGSRERDEPYPPVHARRLGPDGAQRAEEIALPVRVAEGTLRATASPDGEDILLSGIGPGWDLAVWRWTGDRVRPIRVTRAGDTASAGAGALLTDPDGEAWLAFAVPGTDADPFAVLYVARIGPDAGDAVHATLSMRLGGTTTTQPPALARLATGGLALAAAVTEPYPWEEGESPRQWVEVRFP